MTISDEDVEKVARAMCVADGRTPSYVWDFAPRSCSTEDINLEAVREKYFVMARAAISAMPGQAATRGLSEWQPIETAPKDGRRVILFGSFWCIAGWSDHYNAWEIVNDSAISECGPDRPTHWLPLPAAPTENTGSDLSLAQRPLPTYTDQQLREVLAEECKKSGIPLLAAWLRMDTVIEKPIVVACLSALRRISTPQVKDAESPLQGAKL